MPPIRPSFYTAPLFQYKGAIPRISGWFEQEWPSWYGASGPGDAVEDLQSWCEETKLPIARVAIAENGAPLGIAALKPDGLGEEHGLGPFLSALYVDPLQRRMGVGFELVRAIEAAAQKHGFKTIYGTTDGARHLLEKAGWTKLALSSPSNRGILSIYQCDL